MTLLIFCGESAFPHELPGALVGCKGSTVPGLDNSAAIALTSRCFEVSEVMSTSSPKSASASSVESHARLFRFELYRLIRPDRLPS